MNGESYLFSGKKSITLKESMQLWGFKRLLYNVFEAIL